MTSVLVFSLVLLPAFVSSRKQQQNQDSSQTPHSSDSLWVGGSEGGTYVLTAPRNSLVPFPWNPNGDSWGLAG